LVGCANWIITLGRFDILYATNVLARYNAAPRMGHYKAMQRVYGYLTKWNKGKILIDDGPCPGEKDIKLTTGQNWSELYPDAVEYLPDDMPVPKGRTMKITTYVDADHARDKVT
jgi:hypothetical protein